MSQDFTERPRPSARSEEALCRPQYLSFEETDQVAAYRSGSCWEEMTRAYGGAGGRL